MLCQICHVPVKRVPIRQRGPQVMAWVHDAMLVEVCIASVAAGARLDHPVIPPLGQQSYVNGHLVDTVTA